ncbi:putative AP-1 complex subunit [Encephalitozoon cuniculi]|nr:putative AP-1 complex subunit [Encephalitozoon cuniculi]
MIEEIFLIGDGDRVLYGDPSKYWRGALYPADSAGGYRLLQMAVNDVRIGVLYSLMSDLSVLGYMERLKKKLERKMGEVSKKSVLENYFGLLMVVNRQESTVALESKKSVIPSIVSNNVYLDVCEALSAIIDGERVVLNRTDGRCHLNASFGEEKMVRFSISKMRTSGVVYKNDLQVSEGLSEARVDVKVHGCRTETARYWISSLEEPLVMICRAGGGYVVSCPSPTRFDWLEICFPIPKMASKVVKSHRLGRSAYDPEDNLLRWTFTKEVVKRERIDYRVEEFEKSEDLRPIVVNFHIKEWGDPKIRIEKAECIGSPGVCFWVRYSMSSGRYEIRR